MVNTFEEIARKQDVVLRRDGEIICNGLIRRYRPNILSQNAFLLVQQNGLLSGKYLVLVYQWIQERPCWLKKDKIILYNGCFLCFIVK